MTADVEQSIQKAERLLAGIPGGIEKAMYRSMNRALQEGRTVATREATKLYTAKARDIRSTFKIHRASGSSLDAELVSIGANLPLSKYSHKPQTDTTGAKRKQVRVGVKKSGGLKSLGQGFIWNGKVMQRVGSSRLPVAQKYGLAVPSILDNPQIVEAVTEKMGDAMERRMEHETLRLLEGNQ